MVRLILVRHAETPSALRPAELLYVEFPVISFHGRFIVPSWAISQRANA